MSTVLLELPDEVIAVARRLAADSKGSVDDVFLRALNHLAESERQWAEFSAAAERGRSVDIAAIMAKVPDVPAVPGDEID